MWLLRGEEKEEEMKLETVLRSMHAELEPEQQGNKRSFSAEVFCLLKIGFCFHSH